MLDSILYPIKKIIPARVFGFFQPAYHWTLAFAGALVYRFPSKKLVVIAVTGTKGKSSVTEMLNAILEEAGYKTALSNTIQFRVAGKSEPNMYKMSMPGRMFVQRFLRRALNAGCTHVVLETTSQGAALFRHRFIDFDGFIFTGLAPEHIEAHGSYENYRQAKLGIAATVANSSKSRRIFVGNSDDKEYRAFAAFDFTEKYPCSLSQGKPYQLSTDGFDMTVEGVRIHSNLAGEFNVWNELAAIAMAKAFGVSVATSKRAIEKMSEIRGRVQKIDAGQDFDVVVDYAHTPDSLQKLYDTFKGTRRICILGNTGGGRDTWKRDEMAKIAETECDEVILTNEDPYDDDPAQIVNDMAKVMTKKAPRVIMDRREAIATAISLARSGDSILITGKGTDPYIMGPNNTKLPWSDAAVAREELLKLSKKA